MKEFEVVVTYLCNFMCPICRNRCAPFKKGIMSVKKFKEIVDGEINNNFNGRLIIQGGEVFLYTDYIYRYLKQIRNKSFLKSVVTNGFWGRMEPYHFILSELKELGLNEIIIEYDYFKASYIDMDTIYMAIDRVKSAGLDIGIKGTLLSDDISSTEDKYTYEAIKKMNEDFDGVRCIFENMRDSSMRAGHLKRNLLRRSRITRYKKSRW